MALSALAEKAEKKVVVGQVYTESELRQMGLEYLHPMDGLEVYRIGFERYYAKRLPDDTLKIRFNILSRKWK